MCLKYLSFEELKVLSFESLVSINFLKVDLPHFWQSMIQPHFVN
jgi:hypothetical protein